MTLWSHGLEISLDKLKLLYLHYHSAIVRSIQVEQSGFLKQVELLISDDGKIIDGFNEYIFVPFSTCYHTVFLKELYNYFFEKMMVISGNALGNSQNYVIISLKMYGRTYSDTSCNVLKIVAVENGTKFL